MKTYATNPYLNMKLPPYRFLLGILLVLFAGAASAQQSPILSVSITNPANESSGAFGNTITINALAVGTFPAGGFTYTFKINDQILGSQTVAAGTPAAASWTPPEPGAYFITVTVTDGTNSATSLAVRYFATGTKIISPVSGTLVPTGSSAIIQAAATAAPAAPNAFVSKMEFYADGTLIGTDTTYPYSIIYTPLTSGVHTIQAIGYDNNSNQINPTSTITVTSVTAIGTPPSSVITYPSNNIAIPIGSTVPVTVDAHSTTGQVNKVELYIDGVLFGTDATFPYGFTWTPSVVSNYALVALTYDDKNNVVASTTSTTTTSTPAPTNVIAAAPPTTVVTTPVSGGTVTGGSPIQLKATATDSNPGATISKIQFFVDSNFVGEATTPVSALEPNTYAITATLTQKIDSTTGLPIASGITAIATDSIGLSGVSSAIFVNVTNGGSGGGTIIGNAPTGVAITSPATGSSLNVNAPLTLTGVASDSDGNIASFQFLANGQSIATDSIYPYTATWTPTSLGTYSLTGRATDNDGNVVTSAVVTVTVIDPNPGVAPTVSITSPSAGATVKINTATTVTASASSASGSITKVDFFANGATIGSDTTFPYSASFTPASPGIYILTATVTDNLGVQKTSAAVSITATSGSIPSVTITTPSNGASFGVNTPVTITASASSSSSTIANVQFFANGLSIGTKSSFPYTVVFTPSATGSYVLTSVATDALGNQASSNSVTISVAGNNAPSVTLTNPSGTSITSAGVPITLAATATDTDGTITDVTFLANNVPVGSASAAPFTTIFTPTAAGTYSLVARATDNSGNVTSSSAVILVVNANVAPTVTITSPQAGVSVTTNSSVTISATAVDSDGTIASVTFFANGIPIGTAVTAPPYRISWTPFSDGTYRLTAMAIDNSGAVTTSAVVAVLAGGTSGNAVYTGNYQNISGSTVENGKFSIINLGGSSAVFIAHSEPDVFSSVRKTYLYRGIPLGSDGTFSVPAISTSPALSGQIVGGVAAVKIGTGQNNFAIQITGSGSVAPGLYAGSLTGVNSSEVVAIVGVGFSVLGTNVSTIMIHVRSGSLVDAGDTTMASDGTFSVTGVNGTTINGRITPGTGLLTATLNGTISGSATGGIASALSLSDGALRNLSTRGQVGTGDDVLITGFVIAGSTAKHVLVRAVGPSMAKQGIQFPLARPQLQIYRSNGAPLPGAFNDRWSPADAGTMAAVGAFSLDSGTTDAALSTTLNPGIYTTQVSGEGGTTGVALVEFYDLDNPDPFSTQKVMNVSTRGKVGTGENVLIAGFVVSGTTPKKVLIRAVGPTLSSLGLGADKVLADPQITLRDVANGSNVIIRQNDNWEVGNEPVLVTAAAVKSGAFPIPSGSKDSAILMSLPPGTYTAEVSGADGGTGIALVEVYEVP